MKIDHQNVKKRKSSIELENEESNFRTDEEESIRQSITDYQTYDRSKPLQPSESLNNSMSKNEMSATRDKESE
jgi:hypothetical protein